MSNGFIPLPYEWWTSDLSIDSVSRNDVIKVDVTGRKLQQSTFRFPVWKFLAVDSNNQSHDTGTMVQDFGVSPLNGPAITLTASIDDPSHPVFDVTFTLQMSCDRGPISAPWYIHFLNTAGADARPVWVPNGQTTLPGVRHTTIKETFSEPLPGPFTFPLIEKVRIAVARCRWDD